jgi:hypothetical protein
VSVSLTGGYNGTYNKDHECGTRKGYWILGLDNRTPKLHILAAEQFKINDNQLHWKVANRLAGNT